MRCKREAEYCHKRYTSLHVIRIKTFYIEWKCQKWKDNSIQHGIENKKKKFTNIHNNKIPEKAK